MFPGGMGNMQAMMRKVQKMQADIAKMQEDMKKRTFETSVEAVDLEDIEMLEDMILAAVNDGLKKVEEVSEKEMSKITGGMKLPGM